ncbi:RNA polymerase sigma factor [Epibacterium sp. Ofav1-8]|uniref:RNA polymerase sigma factor n=1 Tax=Epibacterium sp. Ofav1-8 TaxID=2917735 RepID=UPI001EF3FFC4|nr:RNA polymerase sigma factor [Epibacterium sp. Ofav1-8]MCG7625184.1 RNA polymerase sigma factor [Epibacterium sp. Ofav1-8]
MSIDTLKAELISLLPRLRRYALSLTRNHADADELVQDACLRALSYADQRNNEQPLAGWLFRILHNAWISEIRKRKVRTGQGNIAAEDATELMTRTTGENHAMASDVYAAIMSLPSHLSTTLLLVTVEGHSYKDAAELLNVPVGTVMSRISRARSQLVHQIDPQTGSSSKVDE